MRYMITPTILSLSLLTVMSSAAVSPALAKIALAFPEASTTAIKMILTAPAIFIIIFSIVSGWLSSKCSIRTILSLGLIIYLIGGVGGGFANSIECLLIFRALLGVGVGLVAPLSTGLISEFYTGDEQAKVMGYSTAASNLGGIIATLAAGVLATISWRFSFGVYLLGLVVLVLVLLFVPEPKNKTATSDNRVKLPGSVYGWGLCAFFFMIAFYAAPMNMAFFIDQEKIGGAAVAGFAISLMTGTGCIGGLLFGRIKRVTVTFLPALLLGLMAAGYFILGQATNLMQVFSATAILGLGIGLSLPTIFIGAVKAGGEGRGVQTMAVISSLTYLGQFMCPIVFGMIGNVFGNTTNRFVFNLIAVCFIVLLFAVLANKILVKTYRLKSIYEL